MDHDRLVGPGDHRDCAGELRAETIEESHIRLLHRRPFGDDRDLVAVDRDPDDLDREDRPEDRSAASNSERRSTAVRTP